MWAGRGGGGGGQLRGDLRGVFAAKWEGGCSYPYGPSLLLSYVLGTCARTGEAGATFSMHCCLELAPFAAPRNVVLT